MPSRVLGSVVVSLLFTASCVGGEISDAPADEGSGGGTVAKGGSGVAKGGSRNEPRGGTGGTSTGGSSGGSGGSTQAGSGGKAATGGGSGMSSGGSSSTGGSGSGGGTQIDPAFKLLWKDDFNNFNDQRWERAGHGFEENLGHFAPENVVVEGGLLKLKITKVPREGKPYSAAEIFTRGQFTFGRFEARIKFAKGSGIVSSLFTYKDDVDHQWQEIDIEYLGRITNGIQYNLITSAVGDWQNRTYQPHVVTVPYKPVDEFHDYAVEWTPNSIRFYIDGRFTWEGVQARLQNAARLRMNAWPSNNAVTDFAGPLDANAIPCEAQYDWVAVYAYQP